MIGFLEQTSLMFFLVEWCTWELSISLQICFICISECDMETLQYVSNDTSYKQRSCNTSKTQTIVLRQHMLLLHMHYSKALVTWKIQYYNGHKLSIAQLADPSGGWLSVISLMKLEYHGNSNQCFPFCVSQEKASRSM